MPIERPHRRLVPALDRRRRVLRAASDDPVVDAPVVPAGREQRLVLRVPRHGRHVARVPFEALDLAHRSNVVHLQRLVLAPGHEPVPVDVPPQARHLVLVVVQRPDALPALRVPQLHERVLAPRREQRFRRVPVDALELKGVRSGVERRQKRS
eukprot:16520-Pelagococcus_subviridis.AAC.1